MNILITSAGRRGYLVRYFKEALKGDGKVIAANSIDHVPAFAEADQTVVTPISYSPEYIPFLLRYCVDEKVDALLSVYDADISVIAKHRSEFDAIGTKLIITDDSMVRICNDKWKSYLFLKENGFCTPNTYLTLEQASKVLNNHDIEFPVIIKPRFGNGSLLLNKASNEEELQFLFRMTEREVRSSWLRFESAQEKDIVVVQEMIHADEYGVDVINDLNGNFRNAIIKRKGAMRSGETDSAEIVENAFIRKEMERLGRLTGHIANMDCDGFWTGSEFFILEMNARFGGGYPFSHVAGADIPLAIVKWINGEEVPDALLTATIGVSAYKDISIKVWVKDTL